MISLKFRHSLLKAIEDVTVGTEDMIHESLKDSGREHDILVLVVFKDTYRFKLVEDKVNLFRSLLEHCKTSRVNSAEDIILGAVHVLPG
jgi:hypothetical protein